LRAVSDAAKLDRHWYIMRMSAEDIPGKHLLDKTGRSDVGQGATLSDAVALYLRLKGQNKPPVFEATVKRGCGYLIDCCGKKGLAAYTRSDATKFRDYLFDKGLNGASVARIFGTVRAVINLTLSEFGLSIDNPFSNVYFDRSAGVKKRLPVKPEDIKKVQEGYYKAGTSRSKLTRYMASDTLLDLFTANELRALPAIIPHYSGSELIRVRVKKKDQNGVNKAVSLSFRETAETSRIRDNLNIINKALLRHWYDLEVSDDELIKLQRRLADDPQSERSPRWRQMISYNEVTAN
jgi:hypothetical protein